MKSRKKSYRSWLDYSFSFAENYRKIFLARALGDKLLSALLNL